MNTMKVLFSDTGSRGQVCSSVLEGIKNGKCMDSVYEVGSSSKSDIDRIVLVGMRDACWTDGYQELIFDMLTNFPLVRWMEIEPKCTESSEAHEM